MNIIDFIIGGLLMNAMPHFIFGITKTRFLGLFGFSSTGNIIYGVVQFVICMVLFQINYGLEAILTNGIFAGCLSILVLYFLLGKLVLKFYNRNGE